MSMISHIVSLNGSCNACEFGVQSKKLVATKTLQSMSCESPLVSPADGYTVKNGRH